jgi:hypothetical protein
MRAPKITAKPNDPETVKKLCSELGGLQDVVYDLIQRMIVLEKKVAENGKR